jgi:hypothetical protein
VLYAPQFSPCLRRLPACVAALCLLLTPSIRAQEVREISTATRLYKEPSGVALASLPAGTAVEPKRTRGNWREVEIEGWIFSRSVGPTRREGFDLVVTAPAGENIRRTPNGDIVGRVRSGTLLFKEEVRNGWTRVRRVGWVPRNAVASRPSRATPPTPRVETKPAVRPEPVTTVQPDSPSAVQAYVAPAQGTAPQAQGNPVATDRAEVARETPVFAAPEGGQYGTLQPGASARVLGRSGEWARVQFEGWIRENDLKEASDGSLSGITAAEVRTDPARYVGRTVDWRVELIAVQEADELRPEMPKGQKYLLTRGPLPEPGFVYVTVTEAQAVDFRALQALQEVTLRVIIKAPRTRFLATPVVELVSRVS